MKKSSKRGNQWHVGDRLVRDEEELRHRHGHQRCERSRARAKAPPHGFVEHHERREGHQNRRQPERPFDMSGAGVRHEVDPQRAHAERLHPEQQYGLRPEPLVLRPPQADPIVAGEDLPGDFAVVGLPRIPQAGRTEEGQVERRDHEHHRDPWTSQREWGAQRALRPRCDFGSRGRQEPGDPRKGRGKRDQCSPKRTEPERLAVRHPERHPDGARNRSGEGRADPHRSSCLAHQLLTQTVRSPLSDRIA